MAKEKKEPKKRAEKYEAKVAVKGTFEDMVKAALLGNATEKKKTTDK